LTSPSISRPISSGRISAARRIEIIGGRRRATLWWTALAALAMLTGCAAGEPPHYVPANAVAPPEASSAAPAQSAAGAEQGYTGLWEGTSTATCLPFQPDITRCNAVQKITLRMFQEGSKLTGQYTCAPGNIVCRDSNTTGTIADGKVRDGNAGIRVMLSDGSSCLFNGRPSPGSTAQAMKLAGSYLCMQGGGLLERGSFQVERSY
jgi:predicted small lipoprotein YifL